MNYEKIYNDNVDRVKYQLFKMNIREDEMDDLLQESFINFYRYYDGSTLAITYWIHIIKNMVYSNHKKKKYSDEYTEIIDDTKTTEYIQDIYDLIIDDINNHKEKDLLYDFLVMGNSLNYLVVKYNYSLSKSKLIIYYFKQKMRQKYGKII